MAITAKGLEHPDLKAYTGRMTLHKGDGRTEEMYYFLCFDWSQLQKLLVDPIKYFAEDVGLTTDAPLSPVIALVKPATDDMLGLPASARRSLDDDGAQAFTVDSKALFSTKKIPSELEKFLMELFGIPPARPRSLFVEEDEAAKAPELSVAELFHQPEGWFFVEFANRTHVLTIYYKSPANYDKEPRYKNEYTVPTVCSMNFSKFAQTHFDLVSKPDDSIEKLRADFIVDYLEDGGRRMCARLDEEHPAQERSQFDRIFNNGKADAVAPSAAENKGLKYKTRSMVSGSAGPELVIEGLSASVNGRNEDGLPIFVCLVNSTLQEGDLVMDNGTLKTYTARTGEPPLPPPGGGQ